jgi:predicted transcriptional regulator
VLCLSSKEMTVSGPEALKLADALNSTTFRILQLISSERLDVSTIAERLDFSEAYVSEQIRVLEALHLLSSKTG